MAELSDELLGWVSEVAGAAIQDVVSVHIGAGLILARFAFGWSPALSSILF